MTEAQAVARAEVGGRRGEFASLVEAYQVPVYNLCARMLWDPTDAEDAAQETFLRAYRNLDSYDPQRPFASWLLSIAAHHCIDRLRRRRLGLRTISTEEAWDSAPDPAPGPEAIMEARQREVWVNRLLRQLEPTDRLMLVFRYWYDLSYAEIAGELGLPVSTIKTRIHRAKRRLAQQWVVPGAPSRLGLAMA